MIRYLLVTAMIILTPPKGESSDASCEGCVFNNSKNYYCKDTHCIDVDRKDDIDVIYKEVKRS